MFAEEPQHAFVGPCEDVVRHAVIEKGIKTLSDPPIPVGELVEATTPIRVIRRAAMPELAVLEVKVARFAGDGDGALSVEGRIFLGVGDVAGIVAARYHLCRPIFNRRHIRQHHLKIDNQVRNLDARIVTGGFIR